MSAKLEKYLTRRRKDLDVESPDDTSIWNSIQKELNSGTPAYRRLIIRARFIKIRNIAATAIILFSLGYFANDLIEGRNRVAGVTLSSISMELGKREKEYKTAVSFKTQEVRSFTGSNDVIIKELFEEIRRFDTIYDQAITDLRELGPNEKVINTIFNTYEQKIRLLELIILETNKQNSYENIKKINL